MGFNPSECFSFNSLVAFFFSDMLAAYLGKAWNKSLYLQRLVIQHNRMLKRCKFMYISTFLSYCKKKVQSICSIFRGIPSCITNKRFVFLIASISLWAKAKISILSICWCSMDYDTSTGIYILVWFTSFYSKLSEWTKLNLPTLQYRKESKNMRDKLLNLYNILPQSRWSNWTSSCQIFNKKPMC